MPKLTPVMFCFVFFWFVAIATCHIQFGDEPTAAAAAATLGDSKVISVWAASSSCAPGQSYRGAAVGTDWNYRQRKSLKSRQVQAPSEHDPSPLVSLSLFLSQRRDGSWEDECLFTIYTGGSTGPPQISYLELSQRGRFAHKWEAEWGARSGPWDQSQPDPLRPAAWIHSWSWMSHTAGGTVPSSH